MTSYTWVVERRGNARKPFRVYAMGTEESGLSLNNYLAHKSFELRDEFEFNNPDVRLTAHQWAV